MGLVVLSAIGVLLGVGFAVYGIRPTDTTIIWTAGHAAHYYAATWTSGPGGAYVYAPPLAQVIGFVPWPLYVVIWTSLLFVGFWAATRWWSLPIIIVSGIAAIAFSFAAPLANPAAFTLIGNPQILIAAVCVLGFRHPALWSFVLLTKFAPGIGLLWFAFRREWRSLGIALAATGLVAGVSLVLAPGAWADYTWFAVTNFGAPSPEPVVPIPFVVRLPMSIALIVWGALTSRRWTVPIGAGWASLALYEWSYVTVWIAALPLLTWSKPHTWRLRPRE